MSIEAMKRALEALEEIHPSNMTPMAEESWGKVIAALRQAIAETEQAQPVAWLDSDGFPWSKEGIELRTTQDTYTAPPDRIKPLTDDAVMMAGLRFADWNRQEKDSLVKVAFEGYVFQKAIEIYLEAAYRFTEK